jgi:hypothetical protein
MALGLGHDHAALGLRGKGDEFDGEAKEAVVTELLFGIPFVLLFAVAIGVLAWIRGESLASYGRKMAWLIAVVVAYWILAPIYYELRIRAKAIYGKVSAIEQTTVALQEEREELLDKLAAIQERLDSIVKSDGGSVGLG